MCSGVRDLFVLFVLLLGLAVWANPTQVWISSHYGPNNAGEHTFGVDAFSSIQQGINAVAPMGTVFVAPGQYTERLHIAKSLTLLGPQAGVTPNAPTGDDPFAGNPARGTGGEAVIVPPTRNLTLSGGTIITVAADQVTISGFTIDGFNSVLMNDLDSETFDPNNADKHAALGIANLEKDLQGVLISHNIIRNCLIGGVRFDCPALPAQASGINVVQHNYIAQLGPEGLGVRANGQHLRVAYNTIVDTGFGVQMHFVSSTEGTTIPQVTGNRIAAVSAGIMMVLLNDKTRRSGPNALVNQNIVRMTANMLDQGAFPSTSLVIFYIEHHTALLVTDNVFEGGDAGIQLWEVPTYNPTSVSVVNTTIRDARYGIWFRNYLDAPQTGPARSSGILVSGVTIINPRESGVYLEDDRDGDGPITVTALGLTVQGGPVGVHLKGPRAILDGTPTLVGQTVAPITVEDGARLPSFARE